MLLLEKILLFEKKSLQYDVSSEQINPNFFKRQRIITAKITIPTYPRLFPPVDQLQYNSAAMNRKFKISFEKLITAIQ